MSDAVEIKSQSVEDLSKRTLLSIALKHLPEDRKLSTEALSAIDVEVTAKHTLKEIQEIVHKHSSPVLVLGKLPPASAIF